MKNLANCKPSEFLRQTNKIRKSVEKWLTVTDLMNIREKQPKIKEGATEEEKRKALIEQGKKNLSEILDKALDEHPDETLEVLALACFVEPKDVDNYPVSDYLMTFYELIENEAVIGFFTSLVRLAQTDISVDVKA